MESWTLKKTTPFKVILNGSNKIILFKYMIEKATTMNEPNFKRKGDNDDRKKWNVCQKKNYNVEFKDNSMF